MQSDLNPVTTPRQRFIDAVVDDFLNQVLQTFRPGRTHIHRRAQTNRVHAPEDLNAIGLVGSFRGAHFQP